MGWVGRILRRNAALAGLVAQLASADVDRIVIFRLYLHDVGLALTKLFPAASLDLDIDDLEAATRLSLAFCALRLRRYRQAIFFLASGAQFGWMQRLAKGSYSTAYLAADSDVPKLQTRLARRVEHRPNRIALPAAQPEPASGDVYRMLFVGRPGLSAERGGGPAAGDADIAGAAP